MTDFNKAAKELKILLSKKAKAHSDMDDAELEWKKATLELSRAIQKKNEWERNLLFFFNTEGSDFSDEGIAEQAHPYIDSIETVRELTKRVRNWSDVLKEKRAAFSKADKKARKLQYDFSRLSV